MAKPPRPYDYQESVPLICDIGQRMGGVLGNEHDVDVWPATTADLLSRFLQQDLAMFACGLQLLLRLVWLVGMHDRYLSIGVGQLTGQKQCVLGILGAVVADNNLTGHVYESTEKKRESLLSRAEVVDQGDRRGASSGRMVFENRVDAGRQLAVALGHLREKRPLVFGVARGGVALAQAVASELGCPFDVVVARKLAVPWNPEAGFGAVAEGDSPLYDHALADRIGITGDEIDSLIGELKSEVERRVSAYRGGRNRLNASGRCAIVVDDGIASGYTLAASLVSLRLDGPELLIAASPAASSSGASLVEQHCDELVTLIRTPAGEPFAVGFFYRDFGQLSDDDVIELLHTQEKRQ